MKESKSRRQYMVEFKQEAVALVTEQGYSLAKAAQGLGINLSGPISLTITPGDYILPWVTKPLWSLKCVLNKLSIFT